MPTNHPAITFPKLLFALYCALVISVSSLMLPRFSLTLQARGSVLFSRLHPVLTARILLHKPSAVLSQLTVSIDDSGVKLDHATVALEYPDTLKITGITFNPSVCNSGTIDTSSTTGTIIRCVPSTDNRHGQTNTLATLTYASTDRLPHTVRISRAGTDLTYQAKSQVFGGQTIVVPPSQ
jgi:hypothetical protein